MSFKKAAWDDEAKTIRGSFVIMSISGLYLIFIILGTIFARIATNLENMATFLLGFFGISFGVWSGRKVIENINNVTNTEDVINNVLTKVGLKVSDKTTAQNSSNNSEVDQR